MDDIYEKTVRMKTQLLCWSIFVALLTVVILSGSPSDCGNAKVVRGKDSVPRVDSYHFKLPERIKHKHDSIIKETIDP